MIDVKRVSVEASQPATKLSWLQKKVCKLFNIAPQKEYFYDLHIISAEPHTARVSDNIVGADGNVLMVTKIINDFEFGASTLTSHPVQPTIGSTAIIFYNAFNEQNHKP